MSSTEGKLRRGGMFQRDLAILIKALKKKKQVPSVNYKKYGINGKEALEIRAWQRKLSHTWLKSLGFIQGLDQT